MNQSKYESASKDKGISISHSSKYSDCKEAIKPVSHHTGKQDSLQIYLFFTTVPQSDSNISVGGLEGC